MLLLLLNNPNEAVSGPGLPEAASWLSLEYQDALCLWFPTVSTVMNTRLETSMTLSQRHSF
jgi:hypothetical protein